MTSGLLLAPATFRFVFLAPSATRLSVRSVKSYGSLFDHGQTALWFLAVVAFGMATRARKGQF